MGKQRKERPEEQQLLDRFEESVRHLIDDGKITVIRVVDPVGVRRHVAARLLDCSETSVHRLIAEGKLKTFKVGSDVRITIESIRALAGANSGAAA